MNKFIILSIAILLIFIAGLYLIIKEGTVTPTETKPETNFSNVIISNVQYFNEINGYLVEPDGDGQFPALILIHEWWGLNDNIKQLANDFAKEGYVVLAVDLYNQPATTDPAVARTFAGQVRSNMPKAFQNLEAAIGYLKEKENVQPKSLASVGWCFGGGWSYQIAKNNLGVKSSVIYYGQFNPQDDLSIMRTNILGHFGEEDTTIAVNDVNAFEAKLKTTNGEHQIFIYPNSGHAFANADNEEAYNPEAAQEAWERTTTFLKKELQ